MLYGKPQEPQHLLPHGTILTSDAPIDALSPNALIMQGVFISAATLLFDGRW